MHRKKSAIDGCATYRSKEHRVDANLATIVLATYNGERFLAEQLDSIAKQTYKNWHLLITDDGSNDSTLQIVEGFSSRYPGQVTLIKHEGDGGACSNFLYGLKKALTLTDGVFFAFCDQDDYWCSDKLERSITRLIEIQPDPDMPALVFSDANVVDENLNVIADSFFDYTGVDSKRTNLNELLVQNPISGAGMVFNRSLAEIVAESNYGDAIWMHDQWIGLIAACYGKITTIDEPLYLYRQHGSNSMGAIQMSWRSIADKAKAARDSLNKKQAQALYLLETYSNTLDENESELLELFGTLSNKPKPARIAYCINKSFSMNGVLRNIGLLVYI